MLAVKVAFDSMGVHSGVVRAALSGRGHREAVWLTLTVEAVDGADVGRLSFGRLMKVAAADCGLFPLAGEGQSIDDGCLSRDLRDSVMGGPIGCVSGLVFAPAPTPMVKFC